MSCATNLENTLFDFKRTFHKMWHDQILVAPNLMKKSPVFAIKIEIKFSVSQRGGCDGKFSSKKYARSHDLIKILNGSIEDKNAFVTSG